MKAQLKSDYLEDSFDTSLNKSRVHIEEIGLLNRTKNLEEQNPNVISESLVKSSSSNSNLNGEKRRVGSRLYEQFGTMDSIGIGKNTRDIKTNEKTYFSSRIGDSTKNMNKWVLASTN